MTMVSELVLTRNQLLEIVRRHEESEFKTPLQRLSNVTAELQEGVMKTRMQPIGNAWQKLPRVVRDLSNELGKHIDLEMQGAETELDRQVLDLIKDPLTHMVRNSADHGLETPEQRRAVGKSETRTDPAFRLSRRRPHHHSDLRRRPWSRHRAHQGQGHCPRPGIGIRSRKTDGSADPQVHLRARVLHRRESDQRFRARRRHGRCAQQYRSDRRHDRRQVGRRRRTELHHQNPADARHRRGIDRGGGRSPLRHSAAVGDRAGARAQRQRAPHRAYQGHARPAVARQAPTAGGPEPFAWSRKGRRRHQWRLYRRHAGRQPDVRYRRRRRVSYRRNCRQADVEQAAPHRDVFRQYNSRRRLGDHDHRSERCRAGIRKYRCLATRRRAIKGQPRSRDG